jgi:hypothetical protein
MATWEGRVSGDLLIPLSTEEPSKYVASSTRRFNSKGYFPSLEAKSGQYAAEKLCKWLTRL